MSSALPLSSADLPGAGLSTASTSTSPPAISSPVVPAAVGSSGISTSAALASLVDPRKSPVASSTISSAAIAGSSPSASFSGVALPTEARSVVAPNISKLAAGAGGEEGGNRVITVGAITQGQGVLVGQSASAIVAAVESAVVPAPSQFGVSAGRVQTVSFQPPPASAISGLNTSSSQPTLSTTTSTFTPFFSPLPSASMVSMERIESPPAVNIFNPENKLFPLGITAVSIAGIFIAILSTFLVIRFSGCTKRRRFDKRQPIPSFIDVADRDISSSFHDRSIYRDNASYGSSARAGVDAEKGLGPGGSDSRYPAMPTRGGWDGSAPPHVGVASTTAAAQAPTAPSTRGYSAYEAFFFPSTSPPGSRDLTPSPPHRPNKGSGNVNNLGPKTQLHDSPVPSFQTPSDVNGDGSAINPFFPTGHTELRLANPDLSRQTTPVTYTNPFQSPSDRQREGTTPLQPGRLQGFVPASPPRAKANVRDSVSSISSFDSSTSSRSAYSQVTRAGMPGARVIMFPPAPSFMQPLAGAGSGWRDRDRVGSLDVPKDAVSRPGSGDVWTRRE